MTIIRRRHYYRPPLPGVGGRPRFVQASRCWSCGRLTAEQRFVPVGNDPGVKGISRWCSYCEVGWKDPGQTVTVADLLTEDTG